MTKLEFEIIRLIDEKKDFNRIVYELMEPEEKIKKANNALSNKAMEELKNHKIDNAIILAAGMATRFVPLSYEIPKGLLDVDGLPLVERQIVQLREKGIEEIVIVVGYKKDAFEYLKEKYGVILVESKEYKTKNNHSSLYAAKDYLKN